MGDDKRNTNFTREKKNIDFGFLNDNFMKLLSTVIALVIGWMFNTLNKVEDNVNQINVRNEYQKEMFLKLEKFTENKFLLGSDFDMKIEPLKNAVNLNTLELNKRSDFIDGTKQEIEEINNRINILEYELIQLKDD